jgi:hypothetical protein
MFTREIAILKVITAMDPAPHRHSLGYILKRIKFHFYYLQLDKLLAKGEILSLTFCR